MPNDDGRFPCQYAKSYYDFGTAKEPEWFINQILGHCWVNQNELEFQIHWTLGDITWEPLMACKELEALDKYLDLHGVKRPHDLLCKMW